MAGRTPHGQPGRRMVALAGGGPLPGKLGGGRRRAAAWVKGPRAGEEKGCGVAIGRTARAWQRLRRGQLTVSDVLISPLERLLGRASTPAAGGARAPDLGLQAQRVEWAWGARRDGFPARPGRTWAARGSGPNLTESLEPVTLVHLFEGPGTCQHQPPPKKRTRSCACPSFPGSPKLQARWASLGFGDSVLGALEHDSDPPAGGGHCQGRASPGERKRDSGLDCGTTVLLLRGSRDSASSCSSSGCN